MSGTGAALDPGQTSNPPTEPNQGSGPPPGPSGAGNKTPIADAGVLQSVLIGSRVTLDGTASVDPDRDSLTFAWSLTTRPAGSTASLSATTSPMPTFTADVAGSYVATLVVSDGEAQSTAVTTTVNVSATNAPPVANAGRPDNGVTGGTIELDGRFSPDQDSEKLTYAWTLATKPIGSTATLADAASSTPGFIADRPGTYVANLVVNDGTTQSAPTSVTVTVVDGNAAPIAVATGPGNVTLGTSGTTVTLDGSGSRDANNDTLTYRWALTGKPSGSRAALSSTSASKPTFVADVEGVYVATLTVSDGKVESTDASVGVLATARKLPTLATATIGNGGGRVVPAAGTYNVTEVTTVRAEPDFYSDFRGWTTASSACVGTRGGCRIQWTNEQQAFLQARFEPTTFVTSFDAHYTANRAGSSPCSWIMDWTNTRIEVKYSLIAGKYQAKLRATGTLTGTPIGATCNPFQQTLDKTIDVPVGGFSSYRFSTFAGSVTTEYVTLSAPLPGQLPGGLGSSMPAFVRLDYTGTDNSGTSGDLLKTISRVPAQ